MYIHSNMPTNHEVSAIAKLKPFEASSPTLQLIDRNVSNNQVEIVFNSQHELKTFARNILEIAENGGFLIIE